MQASGQAGEAGTMLGAPRQARCHTLLPVDASLQQAFRSDLHTMQTPHARRSTGTNTAAQHTSTAAQQTNPLAHVVTVALHLLPWPETTTTRHTNPSPPAHVVTVAAAVAHRPLLVRGLHQCMGRILGCSRGVGRGRDGRRQSGELAVLCSCKLPIVELPGAAHVQLDAGSQQGCAWNRSCAPCKCSPNHTAVTAHAQRPPRAQHTCGS